MQRIWMFVLAVSFLLGACSTQSALEAHEAWTRPAAQGADADVYFALHNHASQADELIGASTDVAESVAIEQMTMSGTDMQTDPVQSVPVKAFADLDFGPESLFLRLVALKQELKAGTQFEIVLHFKSFRNIKVRVSVRDTPPPAAEH